MPNRVLIEGALGLILHEEMHNLKTAVKMNQTFNPFALETGLRINHSLDRRFNFQIGDEKFFVDVQYVEPEVYSMRINDLGPWRRVTGVLKKLNNSLELKSDVDGIVEKAKFVKVKNELHLFTKVKFKFFNKCITLSKVFYKI